MEIQWSLVLFTAISGAGAWLFAFLGVNEFMQKAKNEKGLLVGCVLAAVLPAVGGIASVTHLSHVDHVLWVLQHPAPGIFVEALLIGVDAVLAVVFFLMVKRSSSATVRKVVAVLAIVMGPIFTYSCGSSYMMASQLAWNTVTLPLGYLGTAIPAGAAIWMLLGFYCKESEEAHKTAGVELAVAGVASLVLSAAYGLVSGAAMGSQAVLFWLGVVAVGSVVPLVCGLLTMRNPKQAFTAGLVGMVCGFAGSVSYRVLMWTASVALMALFGETI